MKQLAAVGIYNNIHGHVQLIEHDMDCNLLLYEMIFEFYCGRSGRDYDDLEYNHES